MENEVNNKQYQTYMQSRNDMSYHDKCALLRELKASLSNEKPKLEKEEILREIRSLERDLGFISAPYNWG